MADRSPIEWLGRRGRRGATWNPIRSTVGRWVCTKIDPGCAKCYAEELALNPLFGGPDGEAYTAAAEGRPVLNLEVLAQPLRWQRGRDVFPCSMTDWQHERLHELAPVALLGVAALTPHHSYRFLTKRADRMRAMFDQLLEQGPEVALEAVIDHAIHQLTHAGIKLPGVMSTDRKVAKLKAEAMERGWPIPNVALGVSICDRKGLWRLDELLQCPARYRWVSMEPLLEEVRLVGPREQRPYFNGGTGEEWLAERWSCWECGGSRYAETDPVVRPCPACRGTGMGIHQVVLGGESGKPSRDPRPLHPSWVRVVEEDCADAGVPFHFKQWGAWMPRGSTPMTTGETPGKADPDATRWPTVKLTRCGCNGSSDLPAWGVRGGWQHEGECDQEPVWMQRVGKRLAGRILDGRTHDGYPEDLEV